MTLFRISGPRVQWHWHFISNEKCGEKKKKERTTRIRKEISRTFFLLCFCRVKVAGNDVETALGYDSGSFTYSNGKKILQKCLKIRFYPFWKIKEKTFFRFSKKEQRNFLVGVWKKNYPPKLFCTFFRPQRASWSRLLWTPLLGKCFSLFWTTFCYIYQRVPKKNFWLWTDKIFFRRSGFK